MSKAAAGATIDERAINRTEGIINSMTPQERAKPEILKATRKRRIAAGAGVQAMYAANQFEQTQKMMKMLSGAGGMAKMMRGMKGMLPGNAENRAYTETIQQNLFNIINQIQMTIKAIIFDVDGTLADTEDAHRKSFNKAFAENKLDWNWDVALYDKLLKVTAARSGSSILLNF